MLLINRIAVNSLKSMFLKFRTELLLHQAEWRKFPYCSLLKCQLISWNNDTNFNSFSYRKSMGGQAIQASASNFRPPISTHHHHHHQPHLGSNINTHNHNHMDNDDEGVDVVGLDSSDTYSHHSKSILLFRVSYFVIYV